MSEKDNNSLDKENQEKALKWLKEKWTKNTCECCGKGEWTIQSQLVTPAIFDTNSHSTALGNAYPCLMIVCQNCSNTKFFNAVTMGLVPSRKDMEEKDVK